MPEHTKEDLQQHHTRRKQYGVICKFAGKTIISHFPEESKSQLLTIHWRYVEEVCRLFDDNKAVFMTTATVVQKGSFYWVDCFKAAAGYGDKILRIACGSTILTRTWARIILRFLAEPLKLSGVDSFTAAIVWSWKNALFRLHRFFCLSLHAC